MTLLRFYLYCLLLLPAYVYQIVDYVPEMIESLISRHKCPCSLRHDVRHKMPTSLEASVGWAAPLLLLDDFTKSCAYYPKLPTRWNERCAPTRSLMRARFRVTRTRVPQESPSIEPKKPLMTRLWLLSFIGVIIWLLTISRLRKS